MTITVKKKAQLVVPPSIQRKARLNPGDQIEFKAVPGKITIVSKPAPPRTAKDEYTPEQRRIIDREIAKGLEDVRKGRVYGPFEVEDAITFLHEHIRTSKARKRKTPQT